MNDTNSIQWKRISVEATAIVVSILLAFAIDAAWDERQERKFEEQALINLRAEFQDHRNELAEQESTHQYFLWGVKALIDAAQSGEWNSDELYIDSAIVLARASVTTDLGSGVLVSLISGGDIGLITDPQLRFELSEWGSVLDELIDDQIMGRAIMMNVIVPYLTRWGVPLGSGLGASEENPMPATGRLLESDPEAIQRLLSDPEFRSILEFRYYHLSHTAGEFAAVITAADSILESIDASLAD